MRNSHPRRRLHRLPALFLSLSLALTPVTASALPRDLTPARTAPSPLELAGDPARTYRRTRAELTALGLDREAVRTLWARMGEGLLPALDAGELAPGALAQLDLPNFYADRLDRYLAFGQANPELTAPEVVAAVNTGLDREFYADPDEIAAPAHPLALVNKFHALPDHYVPELVKLDPVYGAGSLTPAAAQAFARMADGARAEGLSLRSVSAYRSYTYQRSLYQRNVDRYGQPLADTFSARPGFSEHQTGLALDINVASTSAHFEETAEFAWLQENCAQYGFILRYPEGKETLTGYRFEPWHYRYVGEAAARTCMEQGLTYEEYAALLPAPMDNALPALVYGGQPLAPDGLMLDGTPYLSAADLAGPLGWEAVEDGSRLTLTCGDRTLVLRPGRSFLLDGEPQPLSAPAAELEGRLYLPLDDLCAAFGLTTRDTGWGLELVPGDREG